MNVSSAKRQLNQRQIEEMPVLNGNDFCRGVYSNEKGQKCLRGWLASSLGLRPDQESRIPGSLKDLQNEIAREVCEESEITPPCPYVNAVQVNDHRSYGSDGRYVVKPRILAKIWNRFIAQLGYTEGNPEA